MKYTLSDPQEFCEKLYESVVDYGTGFARDSALECLVQNYESSSFYDECILIPNEKSLSMHK